MKLNTNDCEFVVSAVKQQQYPKWAFPEIALVGRSNVGKSSVINTLVNRKKFAFVSGKPGRTQTINFYRIDSFGFVDLPGYGYAKVSEKQRQQWKPMIETYLSERKNLIGLLQIVDIRHRPTEDDELMAQWIINMAVPAWVVATKADKISHNKYQKNLELIVETLRLPGIIFSAQTKLGKNELLAIINRILSKNHNEVLRGM